MKKFLIGLSAIVVLFFSGCETPSPLCLGNPNFFVSPSRIERSQLDTEVDKLRYFRTLEMQGDYDYKSLEIIGHAAASFRHYPMNIDKSLSVVGNYDTKAIDVTKLIDVAFYSDDIDSIEIDAYVAKPSHLLCKNQDKKNCSFIMHDAPAWEDINNSTTSEAFKYMQRNTLLKVLTHFVKQDYHLKNKRLYLEIKSCPLLNQENNTSCTAVASNRIADDIKDIIDKNYLGQGRKNWLTIVSFSPTALSTVYNKLGKNLQEKVNYALIAGFDKKGLYGIKESLAQCKGPVPQFSKNIEDFVLTSPWIDRVWFSTKGITKPNKMFQNIYNKRKDLKFSVSSYDNFENNFYEIMKQFKLPLVSVMIDVDD